MISVLPVIFLRTLIYIFCYIYVLRKFSSPDLGPEFQDITSLLLQDPDNSPRQTGKRTLWIWLTEHTKICIGVAIALLVLLLLVIYLTYSQTQLESTLDVMMEMPD